jgi:cyanophycinase
MIIGGAEDKLDAKAILNRFAELAGGPDGHTVVISTASSLGDEATELYREVLSGLGIGRITGLRPLTRDQANEPKAVGELDDATGIYLTGGNQLRLSSVVGGTALGTAILEAHARGAVVAGTSAGASAVSSHMMAFGTSGPTPKHRMAHVAAGLGLLRNVVVDQHFEERTRLGRLLASQSPSLIGLGLDEDTAAIVYPDETFEVVGRGAVTVVDGAQVMTDAFHTRGYKPMMVSGVILHSLPAGYRFDLRARTLIPPAEKPRGRKRRETAQQRLRRLSRESALEGANSFDMERRRRREGEREASE